MIQSCLIGYCSKAGLIDNFSDNQFAISGFTWSLSPLLKHMQALDLPLTITLYNVNPFSEKYFKITSTMPLK